MSGPENIAGYGEDLHAELHLFCELMLGSADAADRMMRQIHQRALEHRDDQQHWPSERTRLFTIAADLCRARDCSSHE